MAMSSVELQALTVLKNELAYLSNRNMYNEKYYDYAKIYLQKRIEEIQKKDK
jgi:hypothetical protein